MCICPQQVCASGTSTSTPSRRSSRTVALPTSGIMPSTRQVTSRATRTPSLFTRDRVESVPIRALPHQQVPATEALLFARLAEHPPALDEPRLAGERGERVYRPPVRRRHLVVEGGQRLALGVEEAEQEMAARSEQPSELGEVAGNLLRRYVDERVPGGD